MPKVTRDEEKKDTLERLDQSIRTLQRQFDEFFRTSGSIRPRGTALWDGDSCCLEALGEVEETEGEHIITLDLPMVNKDDIKITVLDDHLAVQAKMRQEMHFERWGTMQREIRFQSLAKKVPLPKNTDSDNIRASFQNGILEIRIPKTMKARRVPVD
ncbi:MAG: Hsp20/alpha crystallin family protein [Candidatus Hermodarchaeota archaeon]|nr:Hsp20/alpha crystallin family protein [Candidatus Hermodarchaeota archaeon]